MCWRQKSMAAAGNSGCSATLGKTASSSCLFYDVTLGDMDVNCTSAQDLGLNYPDYGGPVNCYMDGAFMGVLSKSNSAVSDGLRLWTRAGILRPGSAR
jgi:hypothetical protein